MVASATHTTLLQVPVLIGAPEALVCRRELRQVYQTNRDIKTWAAWFLLKAFTTSGHIKHWHAQSPRLQQVLQCNAGTLRSHIKRLAALQLATITKGGHVLRLCSYENAAQILQIPYKGKTTILYDYEKQKGNQAFAYSLRVAEIENAKERQLTKGLIRNVNNNPELEQVLMLEMERQGFDVEAVSQVEFQQWLLKMQLRTFAQGSAIYEEIHTYRADINRSVTGIQEAHQYRCKTSVSYCKKVLRKYNLASIKKTIVESVQRCRKFILQGGAAVPAYKWRKAHKSTLLVLCDDISPIRLTTPAHA